MSKRRRREREKKKEPRAEAKNRAWRSRRQAHPLQPRNVPWRRNDATRGGIGQFSGDVCDAWSSIREGGGGVVLVTGFSGGGRGRRRADRKSSLSFEPSRHLSRGHLKEPLHPVRSILSLSTRRKSGEGLHGGRFAALLHTIFFSVRDFSNFTTAWSSWSLMSDDPFNELCLFSIPPNM